MRKVLLGPIRAFAVMLTLAVMLAGSAVKAATVVEDAFGKVGEGALFQPFSSPPDLVVADLPDFSDEFRFGVVNTIVLRGRVGPGGTDAATFDFGADFYDLTFRVMPRATGAVEATVVSAGFGADIITTMTTFLSFGRVTGEVPFLFEVRTGDALYEFSAVKEDATVVPLPATAWLLLGGLSALGVAARRRRAVA